MKFLVDNALSPKLSIILKENGYDSVHVRDYEMQCADDIAIFERAFTEDRIIISADTDFGVILAARESEKPSFILFRITNGRDPQNQGSILLANFPVLEEVLDKGHIVVIEDDRIRIKALPILGK